MKKILVIQDNEEYQGWWCACVRDCGHQPMGVIGETASDICKKLKLTLSRQEVPFDGTLLDYLYKQSNANDLLRMLTDAEIRKMGVILVSSNEQISLMGNLFDRENVFDIGAAASSSRMMEQIQLHF